MRVVSLRVLPFLAYTVLIFTVSSIPSLTPPGPEFFLTDKVAHFGEYLVFGVLLFNGVGWHFGRSRWLLFGFMFSVGAAIGALDEIYQGFVPGREMSLYDWYADLLGVAVGLAICIFTPLGRRHPTARRLDDPVR